MLFDDLWRAQHKRRKLGRKLDELQSEFDRKRFRFNPSVKMTKADEDLLQDKYAPEIELANYYFRVAEDEIDAIETRQVKERAEKFGIPIGTDSWEPGLEFNSTRLRPEARIAISEQIRKERRARIED